MEGREVPVFSSSSGCLGLAVPDLPVPVGQAQSPLSWVAFLWPSALFPTPPPRAGSEAGPGQLDPLQTRPLSPSMSRPLQPRPPSALHMTPVCSPLSTTSSLLQSPQGPQPGAQGSSPAQWPLVSPGSSLSSLPHPRVRPSAFSSGSRRPCRLPSLHLARDDSIS